MKENAEVRRPSESVRREIAAYIARRIDLKAHAANPFGTFIVNALVECNDDERARSLLRLGYNLEAHGADSAIMRVMDGRLDLLALLESAEGR